MINIFDKIKKTPKQVEPLDQTPEVPLKDVIAQWNKTQDTQLAKVILDKLQPTINSALKSYVPGLQDKFRIPAAKLALSSLKNYDSKKNMSPGPFVFSNLQRLNRMRRQRDNIIHIPQAQVYEQKKVNDAMLSLQDKLDREPTIQQLSDQLKLSPKKIKKILDNNTATINDSTAVDPQSGNSTFSQKDTEQKDYLDYLYHSVSPVDQKIIEWSTNYTGNKMLSNGQIAHKLRLSPGAVSQRKAKMQQMMSQLRGLI